MNRKQVQPFAFVEETICLLKNPGGLLVTRGKKKIPNVMAIGWAAVGIIWRKPIFTVLVRPSRYSYSLLNEHPEFTVNLPYPEMAGLVNYCGSVSGRDHNKFQETNLTLEKAQKVAVPIIKECGLAYECQVVATAEILPQALSEDIRLSLYQQGDFHRVYYGEILIVTAATEFLERAGQKKPGG